MAVRGDHTHPLTSPVLFQRANTLKGKPTVTLTQPPCAYVLDIYPTKQRVTERGETTRKGNKDLTGTWDLTSENKHVAASSPQGVASTPLEGVGLLT